jgi:hypothetical protein
MRLRHFVSRPGLGRRQNLAFDAEPGAGGDHWASRLEVYETGPDLT